MERENAVLNSVRARLWRKNQNWICCISGPTGSGKSYAGLSICEYIDRKFSPDNVFFSIRDFVRAINEKRIRRGSAVLLDEVGISWGSRDWLKKESKNMSYLFQVMRFLNLAVIMTVPLVSMVDVHGRGLMHAVMKTKGISYKEGFVNVDMRLLQINPFDSRKVYRKYPRVRNSKTGRVVKVTTMQIYMASPKLVAAYEKKKRAFAMDLFKTIEEKLSKEEHKDKLKCDGKPVKCAKCGHEWLYTGNLRVATCPACSSKTKAVAGSTTLP